MQPNHPPRSARHLGAFVLTVCFVIPGVAHADCDRAVSEAQDIYTYARRAYNESSLDDAQSYMRRARNAADDAKSAAEACQCGSAASLSDDAYTFARRGYNASDLSELKGYARRTMRAAEEAESAARSCR